MNFEDLLQSPHWIVAGILSLSFLGSSHCISMCGPLNSIFIHNKKTALQYHLARYCSYLAIALSLFLFKSLILQSEIFLSFKKFNSLFLSLLILFIGIGILWKKYAKTPKKNRLVIKMGNFLNRYKLLHPASIGFLNGFIPCGWLYSFFFITPLANSYFQVFVWTTAFWLPNAIILGFGIIGIKRLTLKLETSHLKTAFAIFLIVVASIRLVSKPILSDNHHKARSTQKSCH